MRNKVAFDGQSLDFHLGLIQMCGEYKVTLLQVIWQVFYLSGPSQNRKMSPGPNALIAERKLVAAEGFFQIHTRLLLQFRLVHLIAGVEVVAWAHHRGAVLERVAGHLVHARHYVLLVGRCKHRVFRVANKHLLDLLLLFFVQSLLESIIAINWNFKVTLFLLNQIYLQLNAVLVDVDKIDN